jgi:hypothetical protein
MIYYLLIIHTALMGYTIVICPVVLVNHGHYHHIH